MFHVSVHRGNPNKCDLYGRSALHLAAAGGHIDCVTFLVAFSANVWHLDNDLRTSLEVAALHNRSNTVRYLDREMARQAAANKKATKRRKESAQEEAYKRIDQYNKLLAQAYRHSEKSDAARVQQRLAADTYGNRSPPSLHTRSVSSRAGMTTYFPGGSSMRKLVSGVGNMARKLVVWKRSDSSADSAGAPRSAVCSLFDVRGDSCSVDRPHCGGLSHTVAASNCQRHPTENDDDSASSNVVDVTARLFQRPGFGRLAFFQHAGTLVSFSSSTSSRDTSSAHGSETSPHRRDDVTTDSIGTIGSLATRISRVSCDDTEREPMASDSPLHELLFDCGVVDALPFFHRERIDLEALGLLSDADLKEIGLPMGTRRKLLASIIKRTK